MESSAYGPTATPMADPPPPEAEPFTSKQQWRDWARQRRAGRPAPAGGTLQPLAQYLDEATVASGWIIGYWALPGEVDLSPLVAELGRRGRSVGLVRTPETGRDLSLHPWVGPKEVHRFGYMQPLVDAEVIPDTDVGVVLVPGLVFDHAGGRLGFGAGYYDRLLRRLGPSIIRIGIVSDSVVGSLPTEPHDIAMTHLWAGSRLIRVGR